MQADTQLQTQLQTHLHIDTPLVESHAVVRRAGQRVWLKMDALQPSGSFKLRGIGHACATRVAAGARRIVRHLRMRKGADF